MWKFQAVSISLTPLILPKTLKKWRFFAIFSSPPSGFRTIVSELLSGHLIHWNCTQSLNSGIIWRKPHMNISFRSEVVQRLTYRQTDRQTNILILLIYRELGLTPVAANRYKSLEKWTRIRADARLSGLRPSTRGVIIIYAFGSLRALVVFEIYLVFVSTSQTFGLGSTFLANCHFSSGFLKQKMKSPWQTVTLHWKELSF